MSMVEAILDAARWAPSGDNSQPWRFVIRSDHEIDVYGYDTRERCVYDLDGWASEIAHGALLETIAIAATGYGRRAEIVVPAAPAHRPLRYRVVLCSEPDLPPDPLADVVKARTVQRRPMRTRALTANERAALENAAKPLGVIWFESWVARSRVARLCARNGRIRLTIPEAYAAHRSVIEWHSTSSESRMPDASLGAGRMLLALMRFGMASWKRLDRLNRFTGTLIPRLALDFLPGVLCGAQYALVANEVTASLSSRIAAGRAIQRMWLTATSLGLQMQPEYTPLVFARYARERRGFTSSSRAQREAAAIAESLRTLFASTDAERIVWLSRAGPARKTPARSLRLPLSSLLVTTPPANLPEA